MKYRLLYMLFVLLSLTACKKNSSNPVSHSTPTTFSAVFEDFWNDMSINYVYWDIDTTDWDAVYQQYKPIFNNLQLEDTADLVSSVGYFRKMTDGLIDHHYAISFTNSVLKNSSINPGSDQWKSDTAYRSSYSYIIQDQGYLDSGYRVGADNTTDPGNTLEVVAGTIHSNILFFACNRFLLSASYRSSVSNSVKPVLDYFFEQLANSTAFKAVVLDVRDNSGGNTEDLNFLVGRFIDQSLLVGYTRNKGGNGRLDYTPWVGENVSPQSGAKAVTIPVYILADKYSQSMAEIMTMALRTRSQCRVVGETTYGATGPYTGNALYNDGSFEVTGFLSVTTSSVEFKYIDGNIYEGKGFPPDYPVAFDRQAVDAGDDPQLDKVLSLIQ